MNAGHKGLLIKVIMYAMHAPYSASFTLLAWRWPGIAVRRVAGDGGNPNEPPDNMLSTGRLHVPRRHVARLAIIRTHITTLTDSSDIKERSRDAVSLANKAVKGLYKCCSRLIRFSNDTM